MRIAHVELCIYVVSKAVYDRPGRYKCFRAGNYFADLARTESIDMGSPMSVHLEIGPLTWEAPCQWSDNIEIWVH